LVAGRSNRLSTGAGSQLGPNDRTMVRRLGFRSSFILTLGLLATLSSPTLSLADHGIGCFGETSQHQYTGYQSNDDLDGNDADNVMAGKGGDDSMRGDGGADKVCGNDEQDSVSGQNGNDQVDGNNGRDFVFGGPGTDKLFGGSHGDFIVDGQEGDDDMFGEEDNDLLKDCSFAGCGNNDYGDGGGGGADECSFQIETRVRCESVV
jgi:Ca2+-binding RTX toxin-like protein